MEGSQVGDALRQSIALGNGINGPLFLFLNIFVLEVFCFSGKYKDS